MATACSTGGSATNWPARFSSRSGIEAVSLLDAKAPPRFESRSVLMDFFRQSPTRNTRHRENVPPIIRPESRFSTLPSAYIRGKILRTPRATRPTIVPGSQQQAAGAERPSAGDATGRRVLSRTSVPRQAQAKISRGCTQIYADGLPVGQRFRTILFGLPVGQRFRTILFGLPMGQRFGTILFGFPMGQRFGTILLISTLGAPRFISRQGREPVGFRKSRHRVM